MASEELERAMKEVAYETPRELANRDRDIGHPEYLSQLNRWLITQNGEADVRYRFTDVLRARLLLPDIRFRELWLSRAGVRPSRVIERS